MEPGKVSKAMSRESKPSPSAGELLPVHRSSAGGKSRLLRGISWTGNRHYSCFSLLSREVMAHKVFQWRMAGERKQPETWPTFYWVMDIFSKEPSNAALLKVTELTFSMDNINGIVDISISSLIFSPSLNVLIFSLFFVPLRHTRNSWKAHVQYQMCLVCGGGATCNVAMKLI